MVMGAMEHRLREPFFEIVKKLEDPELVKQAERNPFVTLAELLRARLGTSREEPAEAEKVAEDSEVSLQRTSEPGDLIHKLLSRSDSQHAA